MSSAPSPGAVSRVVGYSTTDPTTTFVRGIHTLKNGSYYKRSWTSGSPYSSVPIWLDMDHCPPQQREFVVRPDLALTAMQRILSRIEKARPPHRFAHARTPADRAGLYSGPIAPTDHSCLPALSGALPRRAGGASRARPAPGATGHPARAAGPPPPAPHAAAPRSAGHRRQGAAGKP